MTVDRDAVLDALREASAEGFATSKQVAAVDEAIRLAERARSIQEGRRRRRWRRFCPRAPSGRP